MMTNLQLAVLVVIFGAIQIGVAYGSARRLRSSVEAITEAARRITVTSRNITEAVQNLTGSVNTLLSNYDALKNAVANTPAAQDPAVAAAIQAMDAESDAIQGHLQTATAAAGTPDGGATQ